MNKSGGPHVCAYVHNYVYTYINQVTGGAGFVGSHLVDRLMRDGHEVHIYITEIPVHACRYM